MTVRPALGRLAWVLVGWTGCSSSPPEATTPSSEATASASMATVESSAPRSASALDCAALEKMRTTGEMPKATLRGNNESEKAASFWNTVTDCNSAPGAGTCDKAWTMLLSMPSMANPTPAELEKQRVEYVGACKTLPEKTQLCLTAYAIDHEAECKPLDANETLRKKMRGN